MNTAIIHSKISSSEQFLKLGNEAALLFLLFLPHCDDYGRIKASALHWGMKVCPARFTARDIEIMQAEILSVQDTKGEPLAVAYESQGERFIYVQNWFRYQGFRHDYMVRATCPHPVIGTVEPPVQAKTLNGFFHDLEAYNGLDQEVQNFLNQGLQSRETRGKTRDKEEAPRGTGSNPRETGGQIARQSRESKQKSRENGPSSASASASAPASTSASSSLHCDSKNLFAAREPDEGLQGTVFATQTDSGPPVVGNLALKLLEEVMEPESQTCVIQEPRRFGTDPLPRNMIAEARRKRKEGKSIAEIMADREASWMQSQSDPHSLEEDPDAR